MANFITFRIVQILALHYKSFLANIRSFKLLIAKLFLPVIIIFAFWLFGALIPDGKDINPDSTNYLGSIPRCVGYGGEETTDCTTLYYSPNTTEVYEVMTALAAANGLVMNTDVVATNLTILEMLNQTIQHTNVTQAAVYFAVDVDGKLKYPQLEYTMMYNDSQLCNLFQGGCVQPTNILYELQLALDNSLLNYFYSKQQQTMTSSASELLLENAENSRLIGEEERQSYSLENVNENEGGDGKNLEQSLKQLRKRANYDDVNIQLRFKPFPSIATGVASSFLNSMFLLFVFIAIFVPFIFLYYEISKEKAEGMKGMMKMMGLLDFSYFLHLIIDHTIFYTLPILIIIPVCELLDMVFFTKTSISVLLVIFLSFCYAQFGISLVLLAIIRKTKIATTTIFGLFMVSIVISSFVSFLDYLSYGLWNPSFIDSYGPWYLFSVVPYFSFSIALLNIKLRTMGSIIMISDDTDFAGVTWDGMFTNPNTFNTYGISYAPPIINSIYWLLAVGSIFFILGIYLDSVLSTSDRAALPFYYFLLPSYWGFTSSSPALPPPPPSSSSSHQQNDHHRSGGSGDEIHPVVSKYAQNNNNNHHHSGSEDDDRVKSLLINRVGADDDEVDDDVRNEVSSAFNKSGFFDMQIRNLSKSFTSHSFKFWRSDCRFTTKFQAVDELCLSAKCGQILCLLGQNGAGKTTTFNMLTGILSPDPTSKHGGDAYLLGYSCRQQMPMIRRLLGVCPQFDILWGDLTAKEHLFILGAIKLGEFVSNDEIDRMLSDVRIMHAKNKRTDGYSGGMKRSLSVAISLIGNPKILFLDEPTTGMDPATRRYIWNLIIRLKVNKLIVLTTHSMEEADVLGDKVAIMAKGKLRAVGSSLHLKSKFMATYRLTVVTERWRVRDVIAKISEICPTAKCQEYGGNVAGSLVFLIPMEALSTYEQSSLVFDYLQNATYFDGAGQTKIILHWGLSNATLEDVFMFVAKKYLNYNEIL